MSSWTIDASLVDSGSLACKGLRFVGSAYLLQHDLASFVIQRVLQDPVVFTGRASAIFLMSDRLFDDGGHCPQTVTVRLLPGSLISYGLGGIVFVVCVQGVCLCCVIAFGAANHAYRIFLQRPPSISGNLRCSTHINLYTWLLSWLSDGLVRVCQVIEVWQI